MVTATLQTERSRIFLSTKYVTSKEVTLSVDNWQNWEAIIKRDAFAGTYKETTFPFRFTGDGMEEIKKVYNEYRQNGKGTITIWKTWVGNTPTSQVTYDLDFGTYLKEDEYVEIACRNQDLRSTLKKNEGTEYDIPMSAVQVDKPFLHKRVELKNVLRMRHIEMAEQDSQHGFGYYYTGKIRSARWLGFTFDTADTPVKDHLEYTDTENGVDASPVKVTKEGTYTVKLISDSELNAMALESSDSYVNAYYAQSGTAYVVKYILYKNDVVLHTRQYNTEYVNRTTPSKIFYHIFGRMVKGTTLLSWTGTLTKDDTLRVQVVLETTNQSINKPVVDTQIFTFNSVATLEVSYIAKQRDDVFMPCATIKSTLKALVEQMGVKNVNVFDLAADIGVVNTVLIPVSAMEKALNPTLTVSYQKILALLKTLTHTVRISRNGIYEALEIVPIIGTSGAFDNESTSLITYGEDETADLALSHHTDVVYNTVKVGNSSCDLEGENAVREFCFEATYTSNVNSNNTLDLTCPIRTDSIGFELLIPTDPRKESDGTNKTLFAIYAQNTESYYTAWRQISGTSRFNIAFHPAEILRRWMPLLAGFTDVFTFASGNGAVNESLTYFYVDDEYRYVQTSSPVTIYEKERVKAIMSPTLIDIATAGGKDVLSRDWIQRTVELMYKGTLYKGYVLEMQENPLLQTSTQLKLLMANAPELKVNVSAISQQNKYVYSSDAQPYLYLQGYVSGLDVLYDWADYSVVSNNPNLHIVGWLPSSNNVLEVFFALDAAPTGRDTEISLSYVEDYVGRNLFSVVRANRLFSYIVSGTGTGTGVVTVDNVTAHTQTYVQEEDAFGVKYEPNTVYSINGTCRSLNGTNGGALAVIYTDGTQEWVVFSESTSRSFSFTSDQNKTVARFVFSYYSGGQTEWKINLVKGTSTTWTPAPEDIGNVKLERIAVIQQQSNITANEVIPFTLAANGEFTEDKDAGYLNKIIDLSTLYVSWLNLFARSFYWPNPPYGNLARGRMLPIAIPSFELNSGLTCTMYAKHITEETVNVAAQFGEDYSTNFTLRLQFTNAI